MNRKTKKMLVRITTILFMTVLVLFLKQLNVDSDEDITTATTNSDEVIEVHFIDVGQGDAILIETADSAMLIDAGENIEGSVVVDYLKSQGITKLNYVIGTHPHVDHIGGLDTVINSFSVDKVILSDSTHTTNTFEDLLNAIESNQLTITKAVVGNKYLLGPASFIILAPSSTDYNDLNDSSVVIKLTYGDTSFLLTGDAGTLSENEMLQSSFNLTADVIKLGHHGSYDSTSIEFLEAVNPTYAVFSVGADNEYGHPHFETLRKMINYNILTYRTDKQGSIVFTSNGKTISVNQNNYEITEGDLKY
ncbi:MAG: ComEC/Rec2 family competence protein [Mobilitalea sp.]